jgi:hypothetical protein
MGTKLITTSAKEYKSIISTPGHSSQYRGEGADTYFSGSLNDIAW